MSATRSGAWYRARAEAPRCRSTERIARAAEHVDGSLPITDNFSAYAKAGFHSWNLDAELPGLASNSDDSGTDPTYGLGLQYRFTEHVALRGEYSRFEVEDADVDLAQVQVRFDF